MSALSRFWFRASVQVKFLLIVIPSALVMTVGGNSYLQNLTGQRLVQGEAEQFAEVGRRTALALSNEYWNFNTTQARAIMQSLLLMPNVVRVSSTELAQGQRVEGSPFQFKFEDQALASSDPAQQRTLEFPIQVKRGDAPPETVGHLTIVHSLAEQNLVNTGMFYRTLVLASLLTSIVIAIVSYALNRAILQPIGKVSASAGQSDEDFVPIELNTGDQLGQLVTAFNDLRARHIESTRLLQSARDEAVAANTAKSSFLAMMSHELRTPLNAVIGYSEMLLEDLAEEGASASTLEDLERIRSAGRHLLELINSVLDLSKIEAGKIELDMGEVSVPQLVDYATSTVQPLIAAGGNQLMVQMPPDIGLITSDATRLRQVLLNLLSNAAKFTHGGTITLAVRRDTPAGQGEQMVFDIRDTGIGMTPEQVDKLFQAFVQADSTTTRKYGGTGLGLVISRRLCSLMGGDVTVTSVPGAGSCFTARVAVNPPSPSLSPSKA